MRKEIIFIFGLVFLISAISIASASSATILNPGVKKGDILHVFITTGTTNIINSISLILKSAYGIDFRYVFNDSRVISGEGMTILKNPTTSLSINSTNMNSTNATTSTTGIIANYEANINTSGLFAGNYSVNLEVSGENVSENATSGNVTVTGESKSLEGCSVRAKSGTLSRENTNISITGMNKPEVNLLSFYVPLKNAAPGEGYLTSQKDRNRFTYEFDVISVLDNSDSSASVLVSGMFRNNLESSNPETAVITLDKKLGKASLLSKDFTVNDMAVYLMNKC